MVEIAAFVEDVAHQSFLDALLRRMSVDFDVAIHTDWRNTRRGHGAVLRELREFMRDLPRYRAVPPDLVLVATDANCKGLRERRRHIGEYTQDFALPTICAIPDPHIERWLLLDSAAFKQVFGRGCDAPDCKCERDRYKKMLADAIKATGISPSLGGVEFAEDIVLAMDLDRVATLDTSLGTLIEELRGVFRAWST